MKVILQNTPKSDWMAISFMCVDGSFIIEARME